MDSAVAESTEAESESVAQAVWRLVSERGSGRVVLWLGTVEIGGIDVHDGRVRHAEIPGAHGDVALPLIAKLRGARTSLGPRREVESTITLDWRTVLDPAGALERVEVVAVAPAEPEPDDFATLFSSATAAYVERRYRDALELFEACADRAPDDRRVAHNLRRLRERLGRA